MKAKLIDDNTIDTPFIKVLAGLDVEKSDDKIPDRYIINDGATILFWRDGTKTIVKRSDNDEFDPIKGFLWAYFQKHCGLSKTKANKYLWKIQDDFSLTGYTVVYRDGKFELIKE